jgi:hypothetical protein
MAPVSKRSTMLAAVGQGVLFALGVSGVVRLGFALSGKTLPEANLGRAVLLIGSLLAGAFFAYLYGRELRRNARL